jgi:precorrin-6B methylase 2
MQKHVVFNLILLFFLVHPFRASGQYDEDNEEYRVPYVPTAFEIVEQMLKMANVNENDIVYDLGCGDGRIVITAAKKYGARGVGIDINPERIKESKENALKEGVADRVKFIEQDLFEADISEATVMAIYLMKSVNLQLRPKLFNELQPGTRIVSHNYDMGDWEPEQEVEVYYDYGHMVYFWILPANVSGIWEWSVTASKEQKSYVLNLDQKFQKVSGSLTSEGVDIPITDIEINGKHLRLVTEKLNGGQNTLLIYEGVVKDNMIEGFLISKVQTESNQNVWRAKRNPATKKTLD